MVDRVCVRQVGEVSAALLLAFVLGGMGPMDGDDRLTSQDLQIAGRMLHFIESPPAGDATLAIITTAGVSMAIVRDAMRRRHVPCLTAHLPQVRDGGCLIGIRSTPSVSIQLNSAASAAAGIHFAIAFRMMAQEL